MKKKSLEYHSHCTPGKICVSPIKPCTTKEELSLAYSPGVAFPCLEIKDNQDLIFNYTSKGNLVGVISNGTAVLGLGNIGPDASKPVMEGKGILFKRFANINVFDLEIAETDPEKLVETISKLEPTFGAINLEDIKAPECFYVEEELIKKMNIPVFHDDQHGTAIIVASALKNALILADKLINEVKIVVSGAGSAAIAISKMLINVGVKKENLFLFDSKGLIISKRNDLNKYKLLFAQNVDDISLKDCLTGADVFIGVSKGNLLSKEMVQLMAKKPIIFALANPTPEILPEEVYEANPEAIIATGRSDYPNQVNNVLGFPYIFRGTLDVQATCINTEMKLAAVDAIVKLVNEPNKEGFILNQKYIIPDPFDIRLLGEVSVAVAKAAIDSGVARKEIKDFEKYKLFLNKISNSLAQGNFCSTCITETWN